MRFLLLFSCLFFVMLGQAQKTHTLNFTDDSYKSFKKNIENKFKDSSSLVKYLTDFRLSAISKGYLLSSIDSINWEQNSASAFFYIGPKFGNMSVRMREDDLSFFRKNAGVTEKMLLNQSFSPKEISTLMKKLQKSLLNNGYPFASLRIKVQEVSNVKSECVIEVQKQRKMKWLEIHLRGDSAVSKTFISSLIQIKKGDWYDESSLAKISGAIKQIPFLSELKPHEILYTQEGVELFLYLTSQPVSSINGFLGLQPNADNTKYLLTGDIALKLQNVLKRGELLDINWRNLQGQTQQLNAKVNAPFLFSSPFGLDGQFYLYKRDSTFLDLKSKIAVQYFLKGGNYLSFFYQRSNSSVLKAGQNSQVFTNLSNVSSNNYGLGVYRMSIDYLPNPTRGMNWQVSVSVGSRTSQLNDTTPAVKNTQFKGESSLEIYVPLANRHVIRLANRTQFLETDPIYQNELFRFGGLLHQRGFNEDELFASTLSTQTLEYRFLVDKNSRAFLFCDITWYENRSLAYRNDLPFGFGAGFAFGTEIGTFSILYALGTQQNNPILLRNGRVHFGYIAYF